MKEMERDYFKEQVGKIIRVVNDIVIPMFFWLFLCLIYYAFHAQLSAKFEFQWVLSLLSFVMDGLEDYWYINLCFTIFICGLIALFLYKFSKTHNVLVDTIGLLALTITICLNNEEWSFARCWPCDSIRFDDLCAILIAIACIAIISFRLGIVKKQIIGKYAAIKKLYNDKHTSKENDDSLKGFTIDRTIVTEQNELRYKYANSVANQLLRTNSGEESFAVAIEGSWGSGKTTFILNMRNELKGKAFVLDFNSWKYNSDKQLIEGFFSELAQMLISPYGKSLASDIIKYSRLLLKESSLIKSEFLQSLINYKLPETSSSTKDRVAKKLEYLDKKIFVFIDDLDRMQSDEIFEVLRIIRNTANLPNIVFVVAMDKKYIVKQLTNKGIEDGSLYLEKIFQLEIDLPKIERINIEKCLKEELDKMLDSKTIYDFISLFENSNIENYFTNYRKAKHFARSFASVANHIVNTEFGKEMNLNDLFVLELLKSTDIEAYETLKNDNLKYLEFRTKNDIVYYALRENGNNSIIDNLKSGTQNILLYLFGRSVDFSQANKHRLCILEYYETYFCLGTPGDMLSTEDFNRALSNPDEEVIKWITSGPLIQPLSIYNHIIFGYQSKLYASNIEGIIKLVCVWLKNELRNTQYKDDILKALFLPIMQLKTHATINIKEVWINNLKGMIESIKNTNIRCSVAKSLATAASQQYSNMLLNDEELCDLLYINFEQFAKQHPDITPVDYVNPQSGLYEIAISSSCIADGGYYSPIVYRIIGWFLKNNKKEHNHSINDVAKYLSPRFGEKEYKDTEEFNQLFHTIRTVPDDLRPLFKDTLKESFDYYRELFDDKSSDA